VSDRPHVCQLITALPYGGAEHMVRDLVDAIEEVEFTVGYFGAEDALVPDITATGATGKHFDEAFRFDPRAAFRLHRFLSEHHVDVLHLHLPYAQTVGRLIGSLHDVDGIVSTQHNVPSNYHPVTRTTERLTRSLDDTTVAVSQGVERAFTGTAHSPSELGDEWCTIYNGIDVNEFARKTEAADGASVRDQLGIGPEATTFLNVGRYVPVKGQVALVRAFARSDSDAHLAIVGHGELEDALRAEAKRRDVADSVHVTGRVPEVHPYYAAADAFISASKAEGHPITVLEAMAAGLPVVAPDIPGVCEAVIDGETGILYPPGRSEGLVSAMSDLSDREKQHRYGTAGREHVSQHFDVDQMAETYARLYEQLYRSDR